ncbi:MAG TPA: helix-turn-helix domain-containing protein [Thermoanaerobaculia bacterium]|nr:helix-turn-helix domain-containing protein [Thermoanaerobaculia bacterium]
MPRREPEGQEKIERDFLSSFGARVHHLRRQCGLTQSEVAQGTGCSEDMAGRYERGQNFPAGLMLARLGRTLHTTLDYLVLGKRTLGLRDPRLLDLLRSLEELSPERLEEFLRIAKAFLGTKAPASEPRRAAR